MGNQILKAREDFIFPCFLITILFLFFSISSVQAQEKDDCAIQFSLLSGNNRGQGWSLSAEKKQADNRYSLFYQKISRDGYYPLEKDYAENFFGQYSWENSKGVIYNLILSSEKEKEQNRLPQFYPYPQQRKVFTDKLSLTRLRKEDNGEERITFSWQKEDKEKKTEWWPDFLPEKEKMRWVTYQSRLSSWEIEYHKNYLQSSKTTWRQKSKLKGEEIRFNIEDLISGQKVKDSPRQSLNQISYFLEREELIKTYLFTLGAGWDYSSVFTVYPHWEVKVKKNKFTLSGKEYYSLPGANKLWSMDSVSYLNHFKRYNIYRSFADLQPEKRQEIALEYRGKLDKNWDGSLKVYQYWLKDYIGYNRQNYPGLSLRQYMNYPKVVWQGIDMKMVKKFNDFWSADFSYKYQKAINQETNKFIPYKPVHSLKWQLTYQKEKGKIQLGGDYTGERYYNDQNSSLLEPYHFIFTQLEYALDEETKIVFQIDNLLGKTIDDGDDIWHEPIYTLNISRSF